MPPNTRNRPRFKTPTRGRYGGTYGFDAYPLRKLTRSRTSKYREPDSDSDNEVFYVGQRIIHRSQRSGPTPTSTSSEFTLEDDGHFAESEIKPFKEARPINVVAEEQRSNTVIDHNRCSLLQTLPHEVCLLTFHEGLLWFSPTAFHLS